jgi:hypothetical protein
MSTYSTDIQHNRDLWPTISRLRNCLQTLSQCEPAVECDEASTELSPLTSKEVRAAVLLLEAATLFRVAEDKLREAHRLLELQADEYDGEPGEDDQP